MSEGVVATIQKNQREELRIGLSEFHGVQLVNLRVWFAAKDGGHRPSSRDGLAMRIEQLPALIDALRLAEAAARRQGLLP